MRSLRVAFEHALPVLDLRLICTEPADYAVVAVLAVMMVLASLRNKKDAIGAQWPVFAKRILSEKEQALFRRLTRAIPGHTVLAQVALSQMIGVKKGSNYTAISNRFCRLVADFVVCQPDFSVLAVVELDDRHHDHRRQGADRRKAEVLAAAGISVIRVNGAALPSEQELARMLTTNSAPEI